MGEQAFALFDYVRVFGKSTDSIYRVVGVKIDAGDFLYLLENEGNTWYCKDVLKAAAPKFEEGDWVLTGDGEKRLVRCVEYRKEYRCFYYYFSEYLLGAPEQKLRKFVKLQRGSWVKSGEFKGVVIGVLDKEQYAVMWEDGDITFKEDSRTLEFERDGLGGEYLTEYFKEFYESTLEWEEESC